MSLLLFSTLVRPQVESWMWFWAPQNKTEMDILGRIQQRETKMMDGLQHLPYRERLRKLGPLILENTQGISPMSTEHLQGGYKKDGSRLFPGVPSDSTRGDGYTLKHRRRPLNIRKLLFPVRVNEHWLLREVVESPSLEISKSFSRSWALSSS